MGHLLPVPQDGGDGSTDDPNAQLKLDLAAGRGRTLRSGSLKALSKKRGRKRERNPLGEKVRKLERENTRLESVRTPQRDREQGFQPVLWLHSWHSEG